MSTKNKMMDIISAIDDVQNKDEIINELSDPIFQIGYRPTILRILAKMKDMDLIKEDGCNLIVTQKGKYFYETTSFD